ncbi:hypothetical protein [Geodermatophilus maliterrae]|uniref:MEDS: MEthanogen/methylotroph, DcmR Sensory domain n=1 Tax=Geodermatophilus maliterrae TaxID=3162531 RepID=A0ABV3XIT0_9ACTN
MTAPAGAPVHRCAFHTGPTEAGVIAAALCRRAVAAGSPVVAYVDDVVRRVLAERVPDTATVVFQERQVLVEEEPEALVEHWVRQARPGAADLVTVVCQQPFELAPDVERWWASEHAMTEAVAVQPVALTCLIDTVDHPAQVAMALGTHPVLWSESGDLPNPDLRVPGVLPADGRCLAEAVLDPQTGAANRRWWYDRLATAGLPDGRRDELVLVLHEAVTAAATLNGTPGGVRVRLSVAGDATTGIAVSGEVLTRTPCELLTPSEVPSDRRLLMLWLAEKVSPAVSLAVLLHSGGSRFLVSAQPLDRA